MNHAIQWRELPGRFGIFAPRNSLKYNDETRIKEQLTPLFLSCDGKGNALPHVREPDRAYRHI